MRGFWVCTRNKEESRLSRKFQFIWVSSYFYISKSRSEFSTQSRVYHPCLKSRVCQFLDIAAVSTSAYTSPCASLLQSRLYRSSADSFKNVILSSLHVVGEDPLDLVVQNLSSQETLVGFLKFPSSYHNFLASLLTWAPCTFFIREIQPLSTANTVSWLKLYGCQLHYQVINLFANFLTERKQHVTMNGLVSKMPPFDLEVIQGTVSGPRFFNYYINDLFTETF